MTVFYLNPGATPDVVAVIREELPSGWRLTTAADEGEARRALASCDYILVPHEPVRREHLAAAPKLRMIQHQGVGYDRIDLEACRERGIPVALTPEGTSAGVAEHTILLILALYKQLVRVATGVREGRWLEWELRGSSRELRGKTLGLVGLGRIGREVARRALAFEARVTYHDPMVPPPDGLDVARIDDLATFLGGAEIVSLHLPMSDRNRHFIGARTLDLMRPGAVLINTARGGLVDEAALAAALRNGRLAGAALDVMDPEPPQPGNPLLALDNVLITPHVSAGTVDALRAKMRAAFANLERHARGEPIRNVVPELADLVPAGPSR